MDIKYIGEQTIAYLIGKCKSTFASITHKHNAAEVGADASGSAAKALSDAKAHTNEQVGIVSGNLSTHTGNNTIHITSAERTKWNAKADQTALDSLSNTVSGKANESHSHAISDVTNLRSSLNAKASQTSLDEHTGDTVKHITSTERTNWNKAKTHADSTHVSGVKGSSESSYRTGNVNITKANIGLENVDNTSDANKPVSTAQQAAIDDVLSDAKEYVDEQIDAIVGEGASTTLDTIGEISAAIEAHQDVTDALNAAIGNKANVSDLTSHTGNKSNPHGVTKAQLSLGNVENKSSVTIRSEITKSNVTTALGYTPYTQAEVDGLLDDKVDKVSGKVLSTNDYTTTEKTKLSGIDAGAQVNQNAFSNVKVGSTTVVADTTTDTFEIAAGSGISVAGDATNDKVTITNSGVRSISTGGTNGTISVNTNGSSAEVAVKGLGSAAYTASTAYAAASHGTHVTWSTTSPKMNGTAAVGSETKVARGDHIHPTDTSRASQTAFEEHVADTTKHITSTERTNWNAAKSHADSAHAPSNAQANVIESIKVNGTAQTISSKSVNITVPTKASDIGAAASSHGTHVSYGTSTSALGTSSAGSASTVSRSDHVHDLPALTSCTGTLSVAKGGTGATTASGAITNLGAMDLTSAQTASGVKTFSNGIKIGDATLSYDSTAGALVISFS